MSATFKISRGYCCSRVRIKFWSTSLPSYQLLVYLSVIMVTCLVYVYDMFKYFYDTFPGADNTQGFGLHTFFLLTYSVECVHRIFRAENKPGFSTKRRNVSLVWCNNY